jgi:hypothetical protein
MQCFWCKSQLADKSSAAELAVSRITKLPYLMLTIKGDAQEGSMYFHNRGCMVQWLNTEEGKNFNPVEIK